MAHKPVVKPPHKIGDGGFRREHAGREKFWIDVPKIGQPLRISVTVSRYAGRIVTEIKAPREFAITVDSSAR